VASPPKNNNLLIIIAAMALAMIAGCVGIAFFSLEGGSGPRSQPTVAANPDFTAAIGNGDTAMAEEGRLGDAIGYYHEALEQQPGDPAALEKLAIAYGARADYRSAEEFANQLIDAPSSSDSQVALGYALLADAYLAQGDLVSAAAEIDNALSNDSELALAKAVEAEIIASRALYSNSTAEMDRALNTLGLAEDALADEEPLQRALVQNSIGRIFASEYRLSDDEAYFDQAIASFEQASEPFPGLLRALIDRGTVQIAAGEFDEARESFADALELDSGLAPAQSRIGWSYYQEGESEQAIEAFDQAIAIDDQDWFAFYGKGRAAYDAATSPDDYAGAADLLRQAAARNPRSTEIYTYLGEALLFQGFQSEDGSEAQIAAYAEAEDAYARAIALNDSYDFPLSGLGWILQYQERYEESVANFERAIALNDSHEEHHNGLGWSLYNLGRYDEAETSFRAAIARDTDSSYASAQYGLGRTLEQLGRLDEARAAYEAALAIDPGYSGAQEALDALGS
jgi:serine/threonine-protein kinase